jgi:MoaA/NifB/PqqE/SkfB family radical SAM enzyme
MFYTSIEKIEFENSSICNAKCPQCLREEFLGDYSNFVQTYLPVEFFDRIPQKIYDNLKEVIFCGGLGDPCSAPNFLEVIQTVKSKVSDIPIRVSSNGGMKSTDFWKDLAVALGPNARIVFGIDGLEDTNHLYRINVKWQKVMDNVQAFIDAGGRAEWQFLPFKHNEHQIDQARDLALSMGFANFNVRKTHRFLLESLLGVDRLAGDGTLLQPPNEDQNKNILFFDRSVNKNIKNLLASINDSKISCHSQKEKEVYIDHLGRVFPCCFLASTVVSRKRNIKVDDGWVDLWSTYGDTHINLNLHEWDDIISSEFFQRTQLSWDKEFPHRLGTCAGTCSDSKNRFNNSKDQA